MNYLAAALAVALALPSAAVAADFTSDYTKVDQQNGGSMHPERSVL